MTAKEPRIVAAVARLDKPPKPRRGRRIQQHRAAKAWQAITANHHKKGTEKKMTTTHTDQMTTAHIRLGELAHHLDHFCSMLKGEADQLHDLSGTLRENVKPLRDFIQLDGWANVAPGDPIMVPDPDGDVVFCGGRTREPQRSATTVRIYIAASAERDDVLRIIRKQLAWCERGVGHDDPPWCERGVGHDDPPF